MKLNTEAFVNHSSTDEEWNFPRSNTSLVSDLFYY